MHRISCGSRGDKPYRLTLTPAWTSSRPPSVDRASTCLDLTIQIFLQFHTTQCAQVDTTMAHQLPHMQNIALHEQSRPSPPPGLQGVAPPPGFSNQAGFSNPLIGFHHPQAQGRGAPVKSTPPPPGFGPSLMDQLPQPGTPSQAPPQNGKAPNSGGNGNGHGGQGQRRGPGGSQNLGMPPQQMSQQLPPQMFTTAAQLLDLTDSE